MQDLYAVHSSQGEAGRLGHYYHMVEANGVRLAFIAVDATTRPGYRRPFNFIGRLSEQDLLDLRYGVKVVYIVIHQWREFFIRTF
jgi:hypothetical protein